MFNDLWCALDLLSGAPIPPLEVILLQPWCLALPPMLKLWLLHELVFLHGMNALGFGCFPLHFSCPFFVGSCSLKPLAPSFSFMSVYRPNSPLFFSASLLPSPFYFPSVIISAPTPLSFCSWYRSIEVTVAKELHKPVRVEKVQTL